MPCAGVSAWGVVAQVQPPLPPARACRCVRELRRRRRRRQRWRRAHAPEREPGRRLDRSRRGQQRQRAGRTASGRRARARPSSIAIFRKKTARDGRRLSGAGGRRGAQAEQPLGPTGPGYTPATGGDHRLQNRPARVRGRPGRRRAPVQFIHRAAPACLPACLGTRMRPHGWLLFLKTIVVS